MDKNFPRLLPIIKVMEVTSYTKDAIYKLEKAGNFPARVDLFKDGKRHKPLWLDRDIKSYVEGKNVANQK